MLIGLSLSAGILLAGLLPHLNFPWWISASLSGVCFCITVFAPRNFFRWLKMLFICLGCLLFGLTWGIVSGQWLLADQLDPAQEGEIVTVTGVISDLPEDRGRFVRFRFSLQASKYADNPSSESLPTQMLLSWYGAPVLAVGQQWSLSLKLRRPRGSVNDGGFDYQRWLLGQGIGATGYVVNAPSNKLEKEQQGFAVAQQREKLRAWINTGINEEERNLLIALLVGDTSQLSQSQWQVLRATGTSHLMAISGLHIGLVALCGYVVGKWWLALLSFFSLRASFLSRGLYHFPALLSIMFAFSYALLAGFALPTKRALVMVIAVHVGSMLYRRVPITQIFCGAVLAVLLIDPLAGFELGFWLSFGAVALLLIAFSGRHQVGKHNGNAVNSNHFFALAKQETSSKKLRFNAWLSRRSNHLFTFGKAQWLMLVGLLIPLTLLNQTTTLLSPLANAVAIPLVSFLVVVPLLLAALMSLINFAAAAMLLKFAQFNLSLGWQWLSILDEYFFAHSQLTTMAVPSAVAVGLAMFGLLWLLAPKGISARFLAPLLFLPLFFPHAREQYPLAVHVLDVGQGLAVVVQVHDKVLVYDTGPAPSERFDAGQAIVLPFLRAKGVQTIDYLIVSHGDNDHAGGAAAVVESMSVTEIFQGEEFGLVRLNSRKQNTFRSSHQFKPKECNSDYRWQWHDVVFELLEPEFTPRANDHNNQSCVLKITYRNQIVLLPGDIDNKVERSLLAGEMLAQPVTLLVAPHHGSRTSSSPSFVSRLQPEFVVYSAGYQNRYGHPHPLVVDRYEKVGSQSYQTGELGRLSFIWDEQGQISVDKLRESARRYWYFDGSVDSVAVSAAGFQTNYGKVLPR